MSIPNQSNSTFDAQLTRRILRYLIPYRSLAISGIALAFMMAALQPLPAFLQGYAIDHALTPFVNGSNLDSASLMKLLSILVVSYIVVQIVEFVLTYFSTVTVGYLGQNILRDIRSDVFTKLQRLPISYFDQNPVGRLVTRVTSDVDAINQFITGGLISIITSTFLILTYIGVMVTINWRLACIALSILPVLFWITYFFNGKMRVCFTKTRLQQSVVNTKLNENITGIETVQLFNHEKQSSLDFDQANRGLLGAITATAYWFSLFMPAVQIIGQISITLVLYFGARAILGEDSQHWLGTALTVGTLYTFIQWTQALFQPIQDLADVFNNLQAAMASGERIFEVLDTEETISDAPNAKTIDSFKGEVDFHNVWFAYDSTVDENTPDDDDRWILRGIDLHIRSGESIALVGATGAGKTSITALMSRFYDIQRGQIKIDGHSIKELEQRNLRSHIGLVLQDVFLFTGTIESNLTLNNPNISHDRVVEICQHIGVHDYIISLEKGYQTEVKERGATLSTGQKQLLSFARTLIQNPDILLVLDEATANVDTETELKIQDALKKMMQGRTSVIIAHRLSTIEHCDRIIVMKKGQIVEQGNHQELLDQNGYYAKLSQLQYNH